MDTKKTPNKIENKTEEKKNTVEYDDLLTSAGEFGLYQFLLLLTTFPFHVFGAFVYFSQLFMTEVSSDHWCRIPELENLTELQRKDLGIPRDENTRFGYSQCEMYSVNWSQVLKSHEPPNSSWPIVPCQYGWEFNKSEIPYPTISSDLGWVCDKNSYQATAQAIFFLGSIVGGLIIGWTADRFGRIPATVISNVIGCIGGVASTFAKDFTQFTIARFVMGMAYDNCLIMVYLLVLEYIAPKYRTLMANMSFALFYSPAVTVLPWIVLACGHWKTISLVTSLPLGLAILTPLVIPESPRWLLSKGRIEDAVNKVLVIGRVNKRDIPSKLIEQFKATAVSNKQEQESKNFLEIFKRPLLRKMFILICLVFMCCTIVFDGLVRSLGQLDFDFFVSFSLVSFTEFPSLVLVAIIMDYTGRKWLTVVVMIVSCIFCILTVFASGVNTVIFAVIARFAVNMSYNATVQWAAEILPTSVRGSGVALVHICGYIATFLSPYIVYLKFFVYWLPLIVVGAIAGAGGLFALGLPETAGQDMPQTFEESEQLMKNKSFWTLPFMQKTNEVNNKGEVNPSFKSDIDEFPDSK